MGRTADSQAWMLAMSVSRTWTRFVDHGTASVMVVAGLGAAGGLSSAMFSSRRRGRFVGGGTVGDGKFVVGGGSLHAARREVAVRWMGS
jgi:hypothetical protein